MARAWFSAAMPALMQAAPVGAVAQDGSLDGLAAMFVVMLTEVGCELTLDGVTGTAGAGTAAAVVAAVETAAFVPAAVLLVDGVADGLADARGWSRWRRWARPYRSNPDLHSTPRSRSRCRNRPRGRWSERRSPTPSAAAESLASALALLVVVLSPCWTTTVAPAAVRPRAMASMMAIGRRWGMRDPVVTGSAGAAR